METKVNNFETNITLKEYEQLNEVRKCFYYKLENGTYQLNDINSIYPPSLFKGYTDTDNIKARHKSHCGIGGWTQ